MSEKRKLWLISQSFAPETPEEVSLIEAESLEAACRAFANSVPAFPWHSDVCVVNEAGQRRAVFVGPKWVGDPMRLFRVEPVGWAMKPIGGRGLPTGELSANSANHAAFVVLLWQDMGAFDPNRMVRVVDVDSGEVTYHIGKVWQTVDDNIKPCDEQGNIRWDEVADV